MATFALGGLVFTILISALLGTVMGLAMNFLGSNRSIVMKRSVLWHQACRNLGLPEQAIRQIVGEGMSVLLADGVFGWSVEEVKQDKHHANDPR